MRRFSLLLILFSLLLIPIINAQEMEIGPDTYPDTINPLTGLPVDDMAVLDRRPLIVKVSNFPPFVRQRQYGLMTADIVWEHLLAGGVTRFSAIFYGADSERVGPIRSARLVDFELLRLYNALLTYSGMAQGTLDIARRDTLVTSRLVGGGGPEPALYRVPDPDVAQEHTLYGNTSELRSLALDYERDVQPDGITGMAFSDEPSSIGDGLDRFVVRYRETVVAWTWDADSGRWLRAADGKPHILAETGEQISAANVVIIEEEHTVQPFVSDQYWGPPNFAYSINFIGEGRIFLLRDGTVTEGIWQRETRDAPLTFYDLDGDVLTFKTGNTFFNMVPLWIDGYQMEIIKTDAPRVSVDVGDGVNVNMYYGPGTAYVSPGVTYTGDIFRLIGRNWNGEWLQLQRFDERAIWLQSEQVTLSDDSFDVMTLPLARPSNER